MDDELKHSKIKRPDFERCPYDYRNFESAGHFRGVGEAGKVGLKASTSIDAMPPKKKDIKVPRDHAG